MELKDIVRQDVSGTVQIVLILNGIESSNYLGQDSTDVSMC